MGKSNWIRVQDQKPTETEIVETKIEDAYGERNKQDLKLQGNLWWHPDGKMYVYYTPYPLERTIKTY